MGISGTTGTLGGAGDTILITPRYGGIRGTIPFSDTARSTDIIRLTTTIITTTTRFTVRTTIMDLTDIMAAAIR